MATSLAISSPSSFATDVSLGLQKPQKTIPSKYLYDEVGSKLFDAITVLAQYGATRAETRLLKKHSSRILSHVREDSIVAELGSGSGGKTRLLLGELASRKDVEYFPIEISEEALQTCVREFADLDSVHVHAVEAEYLTGLAEVSRRKDSRDLVAVFLGSTLGNLNRRDAIDFLRAIHEYVAPAGFLLLGIDLMKPVPVLLKAYDDDAGVTAAFNRNLLVRINRELGADFDLSRFAHEARFNQQTSSIEMHLVSLDDQVVRIGGAGGLDIEFHSGETIWTESSHKYSLEEMEALAFQSGFRCTDVFVDEEWGFAEIVLTPQ